MKKRLLACSVFTGIAFAYIPISQAVETITIHGDADESPSSQTVKKQVPSSSASSGEQHQIMEKLNELQKDEKAILEQLADMKQELYKIKVRASRC